MSIVLTLFLFNLESQKNATMVAFFRPPYYSLRNWMGALTKFDKKENAKIVSNL